MFFYYRLLVDEFDKCAILGRKCVELITEIDLEKFPEEYNYFKNIVRYKNNFKIDIHNMFSSLNIL